MPSDLENTILMDDDVYEQLIGKRFSIAGRGYVYILPGRIKLHRWIMGVTNPKLQVDHINGNKLDNRRENLRIVTNQENARNLHKHKTTSSHGYFGVSQDQRKTLTKRWSATIKINYKSIFLGRFHTAREAALAYNDAAQKYGFLTRNIIND